MLDKLQELKDLGISSMKVEGRSPAYVGNIARIYRKALDAGSYTQEDFKILSIIFNRGFTTGFAYNRSITDSRMPMNRGLFIGRIKDIIGIRRFYIDSDKSSTTRIYKNIIKGTYKSIGVKRGCTTGAY